MKESNILAEFETERSSWVNREAELTAGFDGIEDMVAGKHLLFSFFEPLASDRANC